MCACTRTCVCVCVHVHSHMCAPKHADLLVGVAYECVCTCVQVLLKTTQGLFLRSHLPCFFFLLFLLLLLFFSHLHICVHTVGSLCATTWMWRSEVNLQEPLLTSTTWVPRVKLRSSSQCLHPWAFLVALRFVRFVFKTPSFISLQLRQHGSLGWLVKCEDLHVSIPTELIALAIVPGYFVYCWFGVVLCGFWGFDWYPHAWKASTLLDQAISPTPNIL